MWKEMGDDKLAKRADARKVEGKNTEIGMGTILKVT